MEKALEELNAYSCAALWVLKDNLRAIRFYERWGFEADGTSDTLLPGSPVQVIRMLFRRNKKE